MNLLRLAFRYCFWSPSGVPLTTVLSIGGMAIGVASLVVAMAVMSGFESTLQKTVIDVSGHLLIIKRGASSDEDQKKGFEDVRPLMEGYKASTPFYFIEAVLAKRGMVSGVGVEGIDPVRINEVLSLKSRVKAGNLSFSKGDGRYPGVVIGKEVARKFRYKVGDILKLVIPVVEDPSQLGSFVPKMQRFRVNGIISFGHHEFDSRYILMDIADARRFTKSGGGAFGYKVRFEKDDQALVAERKISQQYTGQYYTRSWKQGNRNLFEAVDLERRIIFFVLLIIVVVACFNIAGALFISVVRRYKEVSILKAMGANRWLIMKIFTLQGLTLGLIGAVAGTALGLAICFGLIHFQSQFGLISSEVYQLDKIDLNFRWLDFLFILAASLGVCLLATIAPAIRGADFEPVEGLRYD